MQSLIFFFLCFFIHFLHCMEQPSNEVSNNRFNQLKQAYMKEFTPSLGNNGLMYFYSPAKSDVDNVDSPITILNRTFRNNTSFYAYVDSKRNKNNVQDLMQAKTISYTLFITPPASLQGQVFTLLIEMLKKNPLIFQHPDYKDVCMLDIVFNVRVNITKDFSQLLKTPRFMIDIVNVFAAPNKKPKLAFYYNYNRTREYARQLAIFLNIVLEKKFNINLTKQESGITLQKAFQLYPWVWVSQTYYAQDDVNNFDEQYKHAFFKPNVTGDNESYAITNQDLNFPMENKCLYDLKKENITAYQDGKNKFSFILQQNTMSKNYYGRILFSKQYKSEYLIPQKSNIMLNVLTNNYCIFLTPTVENSQLVMDLLKQYKKENPVIYQENGTEVCFNDIVFNIIDFVDQVTTIGIVINNITRDTINNYKKDRDINTIINVERTKEYTEKLLFFLHNSFEENKCLKLPSGVLERFNILSGVAHIKDLFFVTQRSPLTKTTLKKEYFDEKYNYAYFKDNIRGKPKEYAIDQNLLNNLERMQNNRSTITNVKNQLAQSLGASSNAPLNNNEPTSNMQALLAKLYAILKAPFVWVYTFVAWLFM